MALQDQNNKTDRYNKMANLHKLRANVFITLKF